MPFYLCYQVMFLSLNSTDPSLINAESIIIFNEQDKSSNSLSRVINTKCPQSYQIEENEC